MKIPENCGPLAWANIMSRAMRVLPAPALGYYMFATRNPPAPSNSRNRESLRWVGLAKQKSNMRREWIFRTVYSAERSQNALSEFGGVVSHLRVQRGRDCQRFSRSMMFGSWKSGAVCFRDVLYGC